MAGPPSGGHNWPMAVAQRRSADDTATGTVGPVVHLSPGLAATVVDLAPDAILIVDGDGRIRYANSQAAEMFGVAQPDLLDSPVDALVPRRLRAGHLAHRLEFAANPSSRPMGVGLDLWGQRGDGSEFPVQVSLSPVSTATGPLTIVVAREVSQQRASEEAERVRLLSQDADRIAVELHERVIERMFRSAMVIQSALRLTREPVTARLSEAVEELDTAIREIREVIFDRLGPRHDSGGADTPDSSS